MVANYIFDLIRQYYTIYENKCQYITDKNKKNIISCISLLKKAVLLQKMSKIYTNYVKFSKKKKAGALLRKIFT